MLLHAGVNLAGADSGACRIFTDTRELQDLSNPCDLFALYKLLAVWISIA